MISISKTLAALAATLSALAFFAVTAPAAQADDFCIGNGAQAAHGCGYPTMEACQAASSGIGGTCSQNGSSKGPSDALAQVRPSPIRKQGHPRNVPASN